jgi:hypothetical protein
VTLSTSLLIRRLRFDCCVRSTCRRCG